MATDPVRFVIEKENGRIAWPKSAFTAWVNALPDGRYLLVGSRYQKPITPEQRGYWYGALVDALMRDHGYVTPLEAHDALVRSLATLPWERIRPSTSNAEMGREDFSDLIERACAFLVVDLGLDVPGPEGMASCLEK